MDLGKLFTELAAVFDADLAIEKAARAALVTAAPPRLSPGESTPLQAPFREVMQRPDALPVCAEILRLPFNWAPPYSSTDPAYLALSSTKAHVELIGPDGLVGSNDVRLGLYGILPNSEYGIRTHPAEETFLMLAGTAYWKRGDADFAPAGPRDRSHHASMLPHATRTGGSAFMCVYAWTGDVSLDDYDYQGG